MFKSLVTVGSLALVLSACGSAAPTESATSSHQASTSTAVDPAFAGCLVDTDCVAIPQAGCCPNGWLVAVNGAMVQAYEDANVCTQQTFCPQYFIKDNRVPACDQGSLTCQMVQPPSANGGDDAGSGSAAGDDAGSANDDASNEDAGEDAGTPSTP